MARAKAANLLPSSRPTSPGSPPPDQIVLKDMIGLFTNMDATDVAPGAAQQQINVTSEQQGVLQVRGGFVRILFRN